jgi:hypothetical protein
VFPAHEPLARPQNWLHTAEQMSSSQTLVCGGAHRPPLELDMPADEDADFALSDDDAAPEEAEVDTLEPCAAEPPAPGGPSDARMGRTPGAGEDDPPCPPPAP